MLKDKIEKAIQLHEETVEAKRVFLMKNGMLTDLMQDIYTNDLGFPKEPDQGKELPIAELMKRVFEKAKSL